MDPLDKIFTSEKEIDTQLLSDILLPHLKINTEDNSIFFTDAGNLLPITDRLIIFLLARKVLKLKEKIAIEGLSPTDIIEGTHLKEGSVHPGLKTLRETGLVMVKEGKYFVPNHQLGKIKNIFAEKGKHGS